MANQVPAWATHPAFRDRLYVERIPSAGASAAERWAVDGKAAYLVGRQAEAVDIPCQHKSASRVHACLAHRGERLFLVDLGSVHGTFLNGERLKERADAELRPGDAFRIAACPDDYRLTAAEGGASGAASHGDQVAPPAAATVGHHAACSAGEAAHDTPAPNGTTEQPSASCRWTEDEQPAERAMRQPEALAPSSRRPDGEHSQPPQGQQMAQANERHSDRREFGGTAQSRHENFGRGHAAPQRRHAGSLAADDGQRREHGRRPAVQDSEPAASGEKDSRRSGVGRRHDREHGQRHGYRDAGSGRGSHDRRSARRRSRSPNRKRRRNHSVDDRRDDRRSRREQDAIRHVATAQPAPVSAAIKAAARQQAAAELVRQMGGMNGVAGQTLEQKKKLLWGAKKAETVQTALDHGAAAGINRWDVAEFTTEEDKAKFQKLMGVKQMPTAARRPEDQHVGLQHPQPDIFARDTQQRVLTELESQYLAGIKRGNKQTVGLGIL